MGNKWIKLAVTSFVGILIASFALGLTNSFSGQEDSSAHNHGSQSAGQMNMSADQMTGMSGMSGMTGANGTYGMAGTNGMYGMSGMQGSNGMTGTYGMNNMAGMTGQMGSGYYDVRLYQLQLNMMQLQQQMNQLLQMNMNQQMSPGTGSMNIPNNMSNMGGSNQSSGSGMSMM